MKRILFQGDSITDMGRDRSKFNGIGTGYPFLVRAYLGEKYPNEYEVLNRGISGNRIVDLYARIKDDFINLQPDYASIYIGVNDTLHEIYHQNGVETKKFEKIYTMLLEEITEACPNTKILLIAPFVLDGGVTCNTPEKLNRLEEFRTDVAEKAAVVEKLANKFNFPLLKIQPIFDEALKRAPAEYWSQDGIHPSPYGHEMIKNHWLEVFETMK